MPLAHVHTLAVVLLVGCSSCHPVSPLGTPPQLVSLTVTPTPVADDQLPRLPTFTLVFDRALATPGPDALWLLATAPSSTLRTDARRGVLTGTNVTARIAVTLGWDAAHPEQIAVSPVAPLAPDTTLTLAPTTELTGTEGAPVVDDMGAQIPWDRSYRVAPARACAPIARLGFPREADAPTVLTYVRVDFDRPVWSVGSLPAWTDVAGNAVMSDAALACGDEARGYRCLTFAPHQVLSAATTYGLVCGSLADDARLTPQCDRVRFTPGEGTAVPPTLLREACANDEQPVDVFCMRIDARDVRVRGALGADGAIGLRGAGLRGDSIVGTDVTAMLEGLPPASMQTLVVTVRDTDGTEILARPIDGVMTAGTPPSLRITEVLARAHSSTAQTFVEVLNEGSVPVAMGGLQFVTSHGSVALPDATLNAGARALIVGDRFDPHGVPSAGDPAVAPDAVVIPARRALAIPTHGSDVWLADADGHAITRVPLAALAIHAGVSLVRADPRMREDDTASWTYDADGSSTPGAPDRLR